MAESVTGARTEQKLALVCVPVFERERERTLLTGSHRVTLLLSRPSVTGTIGVHHWASLFGLSQEPNPGSRLASAGLQAEDRGALLLHGRESLTLTYRGSHLQSHALCCDPGNWPR